MAADLTGGCILSLAESISAKSRSRIRAARSRCASSVPRDVASSFVSCHFARFTGRPATPLLTEESRHIGADGALCRVSREKKTN